MDAQSSPPQITIRAARVHDLDELARLHVLVWRDTYAGMAPADAYQALDEAARQQHWATLLARDPAEWTTLLAEHDGNLLGFCHAGPGQRPVMAGAGEIVHLYVHPAFHGLGIGAALLHRAIELLRETGYKTVRLAVVDGNAAAVRFYERQGFVAVDSFVDGVLWRSNNVVMERGLPRAV